MYHTRGIGYVGRNDSSLSYWLKNTHEVILHGRWLMVTVTILATFMWRPMIVIKVPPDRGPFWGWTEYRTGLTNSNSSFDSVRYGPNWTPTVPLCWSDTPGESRVQVTCGRINDIIVQKWETRQKNAMPITILYITILYTYSRNEQMQGNG